ncbi:MAG: chromate transporter [Kiritimatiellia bacterium]
MPADGASPGARPCAPASGAVGARRSLADLAWVFFWISTVTMGGGMAMLPLFERAFVEQRRWMTAREMLDVVAVVQSLPGLIAVNMAVLVGFRTRGVAGALTAVVASAVSPFLMIVALAAGLSSLSDSPTLAHVFLGIRAGTAALILLSLVRLVRQVCDTPLAWTLGALSFLAAAVLQADVTFVILAGFAVGLVLVVANAWRRRRQ